MRRLWIPTLLVLLWPSVLFGFGSSLQISVDQRFFKDSRFGNKNDFSEGFVPEIQVLFGLHRWDAIRLELVGGLGYLQNTTKTCAVEVDGRTCLPESDQSEDRLQYRMFSFHFGPKWMAWSSESFPVVPYLQPLLTYRYARINRKTLALNVQKLNTGGDFGVQLEGGVFFSFFSDGRRKVEMASQWGLRDFGVNLHGRYLHSGWMKHGLGLVSDTGGWSVGASMVFDW